MISRRNGSDASYYIYDGGLSVRALTNEAGTVTDTLVFDAFGNETAKTGSTDNSYGFQGEERDETGLYYLRARYMDPNTGAFTSMDTYGGSLSDPMSLHKYMFANSNPVMYSDPSGHVSKAESVAVVTVMSVLAAEMNGILYVFKLDDNNTYLSKNDFYRGLWKSMLTAFVISFISGIITLFLGVIVGPFLIALIGGIVGLGFSFKEICQGVVDILNGKFKSGVMEIAFGIIGATASAASIYYGIRGIMSSDNTSAENSSSSTSGNNGKSNHTNIYSGDLKKVDKPDAAADALAERIGGKSCVKFSNDPDGREFDVVSDRYIGQAKPALKSYGEGWRNQTKATFEAAKATNRTPYFQFEGEPDPSVINKIAEYGQRYGIPYVIDTKPLGVTN